MKLRFSLFELFLAKPSSLPSVVYLPPYRSRPGASPFSLSLDLEVPPARAESLALWRSLVPRPALLVLRSHPPRLPPSCCVAVLHNGPSSPLLLFIVLFSPSTPSPPYKAHIILKLSSRLTLLKELYGLKKKKIDRTRERLSTKISSANICLRICRVRILLKSEPAPSPAPVI